jgi:hypothetical protein
MRDLVSALSAATARRDVTTFRPVLLDAGTPGLSDELGALAGDPAVVVVDEVPVQLEQLVKARAPGDELMGGRLRREIQRVLDGRDPAAFGTWAFYPWSRRLVHLLPESLHRELRLDRNRYAITPGEQARLAELCVGPWRACRSVARSYRRWCTRASAASCGSPTSTSWTSRI